MYDPIVHIHKTVLMQRLLDAVSRGYEWHTSGTVAPGKARRFADKFATRYHVHHNANQRAYARRQGRANCRLFLFSASGDTDLRWWLCATAGNGAVHEAEQLRHVLDRRHRVRIDTDYEVVRLTRSREQGGGTVWTWRMTQACYDRWRIRIRQACRAPGTAEVRPAMGSLVRTPGFSGIRRQVGHLMAFARSEWRRRHGSLDGFPGIPKLPYVERLADTGLPLSAWLAGQAGEDVDKLDHRPVGVLRQRL